MPSNCDPEARTPPLVQKKRNGLTTTSDKETLEVVSLILARHFYSTSEKRGP